MDNTPDRFLPGATVGPRLRELGYALVEIEVDNQCNMACSFCPLPIRKADDASLDLADIEGILDQVVEDGSVDLVAFHQFNEPLLYPRIWDCLDLAAERGLKTLIVTNGATLTQRNMDLMLLHPPTYLRISAQVIKQENHAAIRGYKGKFSTYMDNMARAVARLLDEDHAIEDIQIDLAIQQPLRGWRRRLSVGLGMTDQGDPTIFRETPESLRAALGQFLRQIESHGTVFRYDAATHERNLAEYENSENAAFELAYRLSEKALVAYKQFVNGRRIQTYHPVKYGRCENWNLGILANGDVVMCCYDYDGFTAMGNIKNEKLNQILARSEPVIRNLRHGGAFPHEGCERCMGSPTRHGASIRAGINFLRFATPLNRYRPRGGKTYQTIEKNRS